MDDLALEKAPGEKVAIWRCGKFWAGIMLITLAVAVLLDRWFLCSAFLFKYLDQDQGLLWYAAREFLHGRFHEPSFYGQDYNTCIESYLAAPLLICGTPYWVALPLITVLLGLLPFYLMAAYAWKRGQTIVAGLALLVPLILPVTYGMVTGMPRGFVPGLALGIVPAVWILSDKPLKGKWFTWRFFWMGMMGVAAMILTANVALLLALMFIYGLLRFWKRLGFWTGMVSGVFLAGLYPVFVHYFYHVWHPDYIVQSRGFTYPIKWEYFKYYVARWPEVFKDLVPMGVTGKWAASVLLSAAIVVLVYLGVRRKWALMAAAVVCVGVALVSCGWSRLFYGSASVFYPYSRFFLAVPVAMLWAMVAAGPMRGTWKASVRLTALAVMVAVGIVAVVERRVTLVKEIAAAIEVNGSGRSPLYVIGVIELLKLAKTVETVAQKEHATMVLFGDESYRQYDYCLPLFTSCETLFPRYERRTWRMYEENHPRYEKILTLDEAVFEGSDRGDYKSHVVINKGAPMMFVIETKGESVVEMARKMGFPPRVFDQTK